MSDARRAHAPTSALPLAYFAFAHLCLTLALGVVVWQPALPGGFFYHPRLIALVHLVTLGWITASILGALYIVAPIALVTSMPVRRGDWAAFVAYGAGALGMVSHFWLGSYDGMAWSAALVLLAAGHVGSRAMRGGTAAGPAVLWHMRLALINLYGAGALGIALGINKSRGLFELSPIAAAFTHAHIAAVGWATLMALGIAYRLVPMLLPARMPAGRAPLASAMLVESGLVVLTLALFARVAIEPVGAALIVAGLATFLMVMLRAARARLPRPPALPSPDWSLWQVRVAFAWLIAASVLGAFLSAAGAATHQAIGWVYGTAGLIGFLAQIIVGMQGRLVPYYAWYRAMDALGGAPPSYSSHALPSVPLARAIFVVWTIGVPYLAWGLAAENTSAIRASALVLIGGLLLQAAHLAHMLAKARAYDGHSTVRGTQC